MSLFFILFISFTVSLVKSIVLAIAALWFKANAIVAVMKPVVLAIGWVIGVVAGVITIWDKVKKK